MTRERRSRSASAWRDIDRFIDSGSATSLISTRSMCTPQPAAGLSIISSRPWLSRSRSESRSSSVALPDDGAQRGLRDLADGGVVVLDVDGDPDWVDDAVVDDGVDPDGDVVAGDAVLGGHRHRDDLHVDLLQTVDERGDQGETGLGCLALHLAQPEHDATFELCDHPDTHRHGQQAHHDHQGQHDENRLYAHCRLLPRCDDIRDVTGPVAAPPGGSELLDA